MNEREPGPRATYWRYCPDSTPGFDPVVFDEHALAARDALAGRAAAGRGNTHFLMLEGHALVLRHYRRGGLARRVSDRRYVWTGLLRTRAVREFELLRELAAEGLPVPAPFACAVTRSGPFWEGSLVTRKLPGRTLAERLRETASRRDDETVHALPWARIGHCIARLHAAGVDHADLNAHNVMIDGDDVRLIDFDRARRRAGGAGLARWRRRNLRRLRRSLRKIAASAFDEDGFVTLERAWREGLAR